MSLNAYHHLSKAPKPGAPLVFAFHGTGGDEHQFYGLVADILPAAGIVSPRGDVSEHGAARFFRRTGEGVYDMADLAKRTQQMAGFVAAHKEANGSPETIGIGYSNGANILASVVFTHPGLFDRVVLMHPLIPWTPEPVPGLATDVLITAGKRDPICPAPLSQRLIDWFEGQGARTRAVWHEGGHEVGRTELAAVQSFLTTTHVE